MAPAIPKPTTSIAITSFGRPDNFVGINIRDGIDPSDVRAGDAGQFRSRDQGVEDIYIDTGAGPGQCLHHRQPRRHRLSPPRPSPSKAAAGNATDIVDAALMDSNHAITFYGRGGDDAFALNSRGVDTFDGGTGIDTAFYNCDFADATFEFDGTHWTVTVNVGGTDYTDTLIGVEGLTFARPGIPAGRPCRPGYRRLPDHPGSGRLQLRLPDRPDRARHL